MGQLSRDRSLSEWINRERSQVESVWNDYDHTGEFDRYGDDYLGGRDEGVAELARGVRRSGDNGPVKGSGSNHVDQCDNGYRYPKHNDD
jgi:hypothetical protein